MLVLDYELEDNRNWLLQGSLVDSSYYMDAFIELRKQYHLGLSQTETIGTTAIPYKNYKGHKIIDIANKSLADTIFTQTGIADYYILDQVNTLFYLPKNEKFIQGSTSTANKFIQAGLPDASGNLYMDRNRGSNKLVIYSCSGAFRIVNLSSPQTGVARYNAGDTANSSNFIKFQLSYSNSIYGKSSTVQPASSTKLIYYKLTL